MDPILYLRVYKKEVDKLVILKHIEYIKIYYFPNLIINYV